MFFFNFSLYRGLVRSKTSNFLLLHLLFPKAKFLSNTKQSPRSLLKNSLSDIKSRIQEKTYNEFHRPGTSAMMNSLLRHFLRISSHYTIGFGGIEVFFELINVAASSTCLFRGTIKYFEEQAFFYGKQQSTIKYNCHVNPLDFKRD